MKYLHTMIRVHNLESALDFLANEIAGPSLELTYNWDQKEPYTSGRNFGHVAYSVKDIYQYCEDMQKKCVLILRPPRDGKMACIRSPDQISVELLQEGDPLPPEESWLSMPNEGEW